jgi:hypothetical protein
MDNILGISKERIRKTTINNLIVAGVIAEGEAEMVTGALEQMNDQDLIQVVLDSHVLAENQRAVLASYHLDERKN